MKISYLNAQPYEFKNKFQNEINIAPLNIKNNNRNMDLKSPNAQHLRANFLIGFSGKHDNHDYDDLGNDIPNKYLPATLKDTPSINLYKRQEKPFNIPFYNSNANDLAIVMGADKNAIVTYDDITSKPELLVDKFKCNIKSGKYKKEGFNPDKTIFFNFDHSKPEIPLKSILDIADKNKDSKVLIFAQDFLGFLKNSIETENAKAIFKNKLMGKNVQIVGLMNKSDYDTVSKVELKDILLKRDLKDLDNNFLKMFGKVELSVPAEKDTKLMLKKHYRLISEVSSKYHPARINMSDGFIDEIVEKSKNLAGEFPGKPIKLADLVIAAKIIEGKQKDESKPILVTSGDVKRFFDRHDNVVEQLKAQAGQFKQVDIPKEKFTDVGGNKDAKEIIEDTVLSYIRNPKEYLKSGRKAPKGVLMYGTPGTGKTLLATATAGEAGVPFFSISGSEFVEKYVGVGAARVRDLFGQARNAAKSSDKKTAIIFIDEIDAFGKKRASDGEKGNSESEQTLNQLLKEMEGFGNDPKCSIIVMTATNRLDILDPALTSRFDNQIEIANPARSKNDRLEILKIQSRNKPFENEEQKEKILDETAAITAGLSGRDIANMMNKAVTIITKRDNDKFITANDMVEAYLQVKAGPIKKSDSSLENKINTVAHECGHALVGQTINDLAQQPWKKIDDISFITLDARGGHLGAVYLKPNKDNHSPNFDSVLASVAMRQAGGIAEHLYKDGRNGAGVSGDLGQAAELIDEAVTKYGLGPNVGFRAILDNQKDMFKDEIKKDNDIFTKNAEHITKLITNFNKGFITEYVDNYKKYAEATEKNEGKDGKGGNNLSGEEFKKLHDDWLIRTGKDKEQPLLQKKINTLIDSARNGEILTDEQLEERINGRHSFILDTKTSYKDAIKQSTLFKA